MVFVAGRMYSRTKLTRNVWWDDWCVCVALVRNSYLSLFQAQDLISPGPRHRSRRHVECLCGEWLCKASLLPKSCSIVKCFGVEHNIAVSVHV